MFVPSQMSLDWLLKLQLFYCCLGILYNVVSWWMLTNNGLGLSPTDPIAGLLAMSMYGLLLLTGKIGWIKLYRILMVITILIFTYGGIIKHFIVLQQSQSLYFSVSTGVLAIFY